MTESKMPNVYKLTSINSYASSENRRLRYRSAILRTMRSKVLIQIIPKPPRKMEDEIISYRNILGKASIDVINQFFHACIDEVCGRKRMTFHQFTNSVQWTENEYKIARKFALELFTDPEMLYLEEERMPQSYKDAPGDMQLAIRSCINVRREQLVDSLLRERSIKNGTTFLDFDWKLKWVIGSSKLATLKEPLLQLDLIVEDSKSQRILDLELNRDELDMLINALEESK